MSSINSEKEGTGVHKIINSLADKPIRSSAARHIKNDEQEDLDYTEWKTLVEQSDGRLSLKILSAEGAHYVTIDRKGKYKAIYAGPHGPENRPATIDDQNLAQLINASSKVDLVATRNSPFTSVVAVSDFKK